MPSSLRSRNTGVLHSFSRKGRLSVKITLRDEHAPKANSYTTLDAIQGEVSLSAENDVRFDQLSISFIGTSRTSIERPGYAGPTVGQSSAFHTFLKLTQPIEESQYPQPRILEAGRKYSFPFTFVVPERLLPSSCRHHVNHRQVQAAHTHLPPSLGDPMVAGHGSKLLDDMSPRMCRIQYQICARLLKIDQTDGALRPIAHAVKKVRIVPATDEEPPLDVSADSEEFCMRSEKVVKKGALWKKFGRIAIAAAQPKAFRLPPIHSSDSEDAPPTTMTKLHIRFDPDNAQEKPPKLKTLCTKLKVNTFYSLAACSDFPSKSSKMTWNLNQGLYSDTICLASRCVASASWQKHTTTSTPPSPSPSPSSSCTGSRRSSIQSTSTSSSTASLPGPTASFSGTTYYTATVLVPISLPPHKSYIPTFHSCLISRTYALDMCLSYHSPSSTTGFSTRQTISLRIPVQITGKESLSAVASRAQELGAQGAEEFFTPRVISVPGTEYVEQARLEGMGMGIGMSSGSAPSPPGYANLPAAGRLVTLSTF
ncbi:hypothetical protein PRK78_007490 [Emydomyces testavorans]|uniref:Arrestin-like N-terminal domain-containing protein n=1 Tax=Emydomyces testavorans TaxID=2070801 RepID=A0AAF0ILG6_9EURO|nr:hypothetical protein PRK78_007490 [Emydomyces testavorans]